MQKRVIPLLAIVLLAIGCNTPVAVKIFPTQIPAATATATLPPTSTATPTQPPTPTPQPAVRIENAEKALFVGDYETARREFQNAQASASDSEVKAAAALGMGRALYLQHNPSTAIETLKAMITEFPQSPHLANAYYFLARSYEELKNYEQAAEAYTNYLKAAPDTLDGYIQDLRGDAYVAAGNPGAAVEAYTAAIAAPQSGSTLWIELKLGKAYSAMGDFSNAIKKFLDIYEKSDNDYARAQANFLMGQAYLTMGMPEQAHARFLDSVGSFPKAYDTYSGLVQLINDGVEVNELSRGLVDYYAGQYGLAIDAFTRYIDSGQAKDATAYHFRALSHLAKSEPGFAIEDWNTVIEKFPSDNLWASAWDEKAYVQWAYLSKYEDAESTLLEYVKQSPNSSQTPDMLFQAARVYERNSQLTQAAETWEELINKYPQAEMSYRGLFLAGVSYYRAKEYDKAILAFQRYMVLAQTPNDQAAAYVWVGKSQKAKGDGDAAKTAWEQAAQRDPTGYYSVRANELLQGQAPFTASAPIDLGYDLNQERGQAEEWLRDTFKLPADTDLNGPGDMASDEHYQRGMAFWQLGLYDDARTEFEALRKIVLSDPVKTYRLMNVMLDLGIYRSAILSSRQILDLANLDDVGTLKAPAYFNHIRFGVYFKDQVMAAGRADNFSPLFLLSVLRQESMFEGFAISSAGARGLMQIMPATGHEIASSMSWPAGYTDEDLYRPVISIPLGTHYLARQRDYFGGSLYATLSAYNGGPGNTGYWKDMAGDDPDLLLEVIRADETRTYIMYIYEYFNIYRLLYERGQ